MRRLPVYLLLDVSGSMAGVPIEQVKSGVQMLVAGLRQDPYALETVHIGVVTFSGHAEELVPLTELAAFQAPELTASGGTSLGRGLSLLADCAARDVKKSTSSQKGDWRPMVFLMTDAQPTETEWRDGLARFRSEKWGVFVGCAVNTADTVLLSEIVGSENVVRLDTADAGSVRAFFKWVTASVSTSSRGIEQSGAQPTGMEHLPPPPKEIQVVI